MFGILARQTAVALENARLYEELRTYVRQVEESQRALIQSEKMAAVGRLTASIAHEVNNPLQSVRNCLHLIGREGLPKEDHNRYLQMAKDELERLMHTVQRMLDFYRPGALQRKPTDINGLLQRVLDLLQQQLVHQNITAHMDLEENLPPVVVVSNQIQQVFFNLLLNAMGMMPKGGEISITTRLITRGAKAISVIVEDTGPGVPPELRERIFEPFMSTKEDGTGLGLSVSYGILTAHGGNLGLVEGQGKGACFRVMIPVEEIT
jgi:two-component system NtrC family sensor kinase